MLNHIMKVLIIFSQMFNLYQLVLASLRTVKRKKPADTPVTTALFGSYISLLAGYHMS